jgi:hypothetical protein
MKAFPLFRAVRRVQGRRAAGLFEIFEAQALGGCRSQPILARLIDLLRPGDALIVIRQATGRRKFETHPGGMAS